VRYIFGRVDGENCALGASQLLAQLRGLARACIDDENFDWTKDHGERAHSLAALTGSACKLVAEKSRMV
jgi:hypothetical protein